jgi:hypothetical protein
LLSIGFHPYSITICIAITSFMFKSLVLSQHGCKAHQKRIKIKNNRQKY